MGDASIDNDTSTHGTTSKSPKEFKIITNRGKDLFALGTKKNSPRSTEASKLLEPESESENAKLARKRKLNEELWEVAGLGDLSKIARLLEPYFTFINIL